MKVLLPSFLPKDIIVPKSAAVSNDFGKFVLPDIPAVQTDLVVDPRREATLITRVKRFAVRAAMRMSFHIVYSSGNEGSGMIADPQLLRHESGSCERANDGLRVEGKCGLILIIA
jgi:hypothetical protein